MKKSQIIITEKQFRRLYETGSNSAAMDLDIYVQPVSHDTSTGNNDLIDALEDIESMYKELKNELESGKKIKQNEKNNIFKLVDDFNKIYKSIKFSD